MIRLRRHGHDPGGPSRPPRGPSWWLSWIAMGLALWLALKLAFGWVVKACFYGFRG